MNTRKFKIKSVIIQRCRKGSGQVSTGVQITGNASHKNPVRYLTGDRMAWPLRPLVFKGKNRMERLYRAQLTD